MIKKITDLILNKKIQRGLACLMLSNSCICIASSVDYDTAKGIASQYINNPRISTQARSAAGNTLMPMYVFNSSDPDGGFVIVSGDDSINPVIGYSDRGSIDSGNLPEPLRLMLEEISELNPPASSVRFSASSRAEVVVAPLIKTKWYQLEPYNSKLPSQAYLTGCVATAMSQVMAYHRWPETGHGQVAYNSFTPAGNGDASDPAGWMEADLSKSVYDWDHMKDVYLNGDWTQQEADAVGLLMRDCGYAVNMQYSMLFSGAYDSDAAAALMEHFGYDAEVWPCFGDYPLTVWIEKLKSELDAGYPVLMTGQKTPVGYGGHCFIADGYDSNDYLHINWGWNGEANGFYNVTLLTPEHKGHNNYSFMKYFTSVRPRKPYSDAVYNPALVMLYDIKHKDFDHSGLMAENAGTVLSESNPGKIKAEGLCFVSAKRYDGLFTLVLLDEEGNEVKTVCTAEISHDELDKDGSQEVTLPSLEIPAAVFDDVPEGDYKIVAMGRYNQLPPRKIQVYGYKHHINVNISGGKTTLANIDKKSAAFRINTTFDLPEEVPMYSTYSFPVEIANEGDFIGGGQFVVQAVNPSNQYDKRRLSVQDFALEPGDKAEFMINLAFPYLDNGSSFSDGSQWRIEVVVVDYNNNPVELINPVDPTNVRIITDPAYLPQMKLTSLKIREEEGDYIDMANIVLDISKNYVIECETEIVTQYARPQGFKMYWDIEETGVSGEVEVSPDGTASLEALLMWMVPPVGEHWLSISQDDFATGKPVVCSPESVARRKVTIIDSSAGIESVGGDDKQEAARYNMQGMKINGRQSGINIVVYSDGTVRKECVK